MYNKSIKMSQAIDYYPEFFEPRPVSPKKAPIRAIKIHRKIGIKTSLEEIPSILGKRKLGDAFGENIYNDQERYGQEIPPDFFKINAAK